jgi:hypothetical protein
MRSVSTRGRDQNSFFLHGYKEEHMTAHMGKVPSIGQEKRPQKKKLETPWNLDLGFQHPEQEMHFCCFSCQVQGILPLPLRLLRVIMKT